MADNVLGSAGVGAGSPARSEFGVLPSAAMPQLPKAASAPAPEALLTPSILYSGEANNETDLLDHAALVQPVAELLSHVKTPMPLTVALLGGPGTGKSFALSRLLGIIQQRTALAKSHGPTVAKVLTLQLDAAELAGEPGPALGAAMCRAMLNSGNPAYAELAQLAAHAHTDPHSIAEIAREKLAASRLQLDSESRLLGEIRGRAAKLSDTLLNDPAGTPLDAYLRSQRNTIEARLRGFGFLRGDTSSNYRDLVRDLHESGGRAPSISAFLRAMWAFKGQMRLIFWAVFFVALGIGAGVLQATKTSWMDNLFGLGQYFPQLAGWIALHESWLGWVRLAAFGLAGLSLARNFWRAWRFTRPLVKGLALLRADIATQSGALEVLAAQQTRRLAALQLDIQKHEQIAMAAEQRAAALSTGATGAAPFAVAPEILTAISPAQAFPANLASLLADHKTATTDAPQRIILAIDNLDGLDPARAANIMEVATRLFSHTTYGLVWAMDPKTLANAWVDSAGRLDKLVQVPLQISRNGLTSAQSSTMVLNLLGHAGAGSKAATRYDQARSMLERPVTVQEAKLLTELGAMAGRSARNVTRMVNLWRLARAPAPEFAPVAAFMLALDIGGTSAEVNAMRNALANARPDAIFTVADGGARLDAALDALKTAAGGNLTGAMMMGGLAAASPYMRR